MNEPDEHDLASLRKVAAVDPFFQAIFSTVEQGVPWMKALVAVCLALQDANARLQADLLQRMMNDGIMNHAITTKLGASPELAELMAQDPLLHVTFDKPKSD